MAECHGGLEPRWSGATTHMCFPAIAARRETEPFNRSMFTKAACTGDPSPHIGARPVGHITLMAAGMTRLANRNQDGSGTKRSHIEGLMDNLIARVTLKTPVQPISGWFMQQREMDFAGLLQDIAGQAKLHALDTLRILSRARLPLVDDAPKHSSST